MIARLVVALFGLLTLVGAAWAVRDFVGTHYISRVEHDRVLDQIEQASKDATNEKKRIADLVEKEVDATPTDTDDDIKRLCQHSASCRERGQLLRHSKEGAVVNPGHQENNQRGSQGKPKD